MYSFFKVDEIPSLKYNLKLYYSSIDCCQKNFIANSELIAINNGFCDYFGNCNCKNDYYTSNCQLFAPNWKHQKMAPWDLNSSW